MYEYFFLLEKYIEIVGLVSKEDSRLAELTRFRPACVNTNLLVASFARSCIHNAVGIRENIPSIDLHVRARHAFLLSFEYDYSYGGTRYKGRPIVVVTAPL